MTDLAHEPVFWTGDSAVCEPLAHGESVAAHFHDFGQLRYAASGALVTATQVGTWVTPASRITWVPPFSVHSSRSYGETDVRLLRVPAELAEQLPPEPSVFVASALMREAYLAKINDNDPADSPRARLLLEVVISELARARGNHCASPSRATPASRPSPTCCTPTRPARRHWRNWGTEPVRANEPSAVCSAANCR